MSWRSLDGRPTLALEGDDAASGQAAQRRSAVLLVFLGPEIDRLAVDGEDVEQVVVNQ